MADAGGRGGGVRRSRGHRALASGAVVATDRSVTDWGDAQAIRGADGSARWIVGVDGQGRLHYLRGMSSFEDVSSRYGLDGRRVLGVAMIDRARVGFLLDAGDRRGRRAPRHPLRGAARGHAARRGRASAPGSARGRSPVRREDGERTFPLPGVTAAALGADGRLYAATRRALYATTSTVISRSSTTRSAETLHGLVASGDAGVVRGRHGARRRGRRARGGDERRAGRARREARVVPQR